MEAMVLRECAFEGAPLPVYAVEGRPHWVARQVGAALGYGKEGGELVTSISKNWRGAVAEGDEVLILSGRKLQDFKRLVGDHGSSPLSLTARLMLLSEKGMYKVLMLTRQTAGDRMRDWLAAEVLPQIARDGHFAPDRQVVGGQLTGGTALVRVEVAETRALAALRRAEAALARGNAMERNSIVRERQFALRERQAKQRAHAHAARAQLNAGLISPVEFAAHVRHAAELVVEGRIEMLSGNDPHGPWLRARDLARKWGVSEQAVGRAAVALGLRGNIPGLVREAMGRREYAGGSAVTHEYSVQAQARIQTYLFADRDRQGELPLA